MAACRNILSGSLFIATYLQSVAVNGTVNGMEYSSTWLLVPRSGAVPMSWQKLLGRICCFLLYMCLQTCTRQI